MELDTNARLIIEFESHLSVRKTVTFKIKRQHVICSNKIYFRPQKRPDDTNSLTNTLTASLLKP